MPSNTINDTHDRMFEFDEELIEEKRSNNDIMEDTEKKERKIYVGKQKIYFGKKKAFFQSPPWKYTKTF